jgi:thiol-disulfide isomerase/thioredoxin
MIIGALLGLALGSLAWSAGAKGDVVGTLRFADANGQPISLDAKGVVYLVDFWGLGCKPCMVEMPDLDRLASEYGSSGKARLISIAAGGWSGAQLRTVATNAGTTQQVLADPEHWHDRLGINAYPTKLLIRDGTVIARKVGGGVEAYDYWKSAIERELKAAAEAK